MFPRHLEEQEIQSPARDCQPTRPFRSGPAHPSTSAPLHPHPPHPTSGLTVSSCTGFFLYLKFTKPFGGAFAHPPPLNVYMAATFLFHRFQLKCHLLRGAFLTTCSVIASHSHSRPCQPPFILFYFIFVCGSYQYPKLSHVFFYLHFLSVCTTGTCLDRAGEWAAGPIRCDWGCPGGEEMPGAQVWRRPWQRLGDEVTLK